VVIMLATGPKFRGFKPGRERWILRAIKIRSKTSFRGKVKLSAPCRNILWHVKILYSMKHTDMQNSAAFFAQCLPVSLIGTSAATRAENSGG
jgi:hypothetical protein